MQKEVYTQSKQQFRSFLKDLKKSFELIAPVKSDVVRFEPISNVDDIHLDKNSYFPVKEYFFKKEEVLFQFTGTKIRVPSQKTPKRVFFGLRRCDLNGIMHQDLVFTEQVNDPYYIAARKNSYLLGYHCPKAPSPYCFCGSMKLKEYFDLMFYDYADHFLIEVGSEKGKKLVKQYSSYLSQVPTSIPESAKHIPGADRLEKKDIAHFYNHPDWKKGVDQCLSCAACTNLCPTCYCHSMHDEVSTKNPARGERKRTWSSCQLPEFSRVAGDHIFREGREERFKHRIYHQLQYFEEKNGVDLCVGCGRCIEGCPTRIDFVKIINEMK